MMLKLQKRPLIIDLFSGIGGLTLGLESSGMEPAIAVEKNPVIAAIHKYNFPNCFMFCSDVKAITPSDIAQAIIDNHGGDNHLILAAGSPCQAYSKSGKRDPNDERAKLIFELLPFLDKLKPEYFVFENVPELAKLENVFLPFISQVEEIGYNVIAPVENAVNFGAVQSRERLFIIGYRKDCRHVDPPKHTHGFELEPFNYVGDAIADLAKVDPTAESFSYISEFQLDYSGFRVQYNPEALGIFKLCHERFINGKICGHAGTNHKLEVINRFSETVPGAIEKISRFPRLKIDSFSPTLLAGTNSDKGSHTSKRPIHYQHSRVITPREYARIQGFPDWYRLHRTKWRSYHGLGNSVIPVMGHAIGKEIMKALQIDTKGIVIEKYPESNRDLLTFDHTTACEYFDVDPGIIPPRTKKKKVKAA